MSEPLSGEGWSSTRERSAPSPISPPQPLAIAAHRIHPDTRPSFVHLKVANLAKLLPFYQSILGLQVNHLTERKAVLGISGRDLVILEEYPQGKRYRGVSGLYHFALLLPNRRELARAIARLLTFGYLNYPTDHIMTKATYLDDPEGNSIELYCESPEDGIFCFQNGQFIAMRADGSLSDGREPLDLKRLFLYLERDDDLDTTLPSETVIGHFHLHVSNLEHARHFYHDLLGFDDMGLAPRFRMGMVSAGGYHHHIGYNTWQGEGAPPPPRDALGLEAIAFAFPHAEAWKAFCEQLQKRAIPFQQKERSISLTDPSGNRVIFLAKPS